MPEGRPYFPKFAITVVESLELCLRPRTGEVTLAADLDYSRSASRLSEQRHAQLQIWWRERMGIIYEEHLARLGFAAEVQLPVTGEPRVQLSAGTLASPLASVVTENAGYPRLKLTADVDAGEALFRRGIASPAFTSVRVEVVGLAREVARLGSWVPPLEHVSGPGSARPLPIEQATYPAGYAGRVSFRVPIDVDAHQPRRRAKSLRDGGDGSGSLKLGVSRKGAKLEYEARWGLLPDSQKRVEKLLQARLTLNDVG